MSEFLQEKHLESVMPKVLLDTVALKHSTNFKRRIVPVNRQIRNWYGEVTGIIVSEIKVVDYNEKITDSVLKKEAQLLQEIADAAKAGKLRIFIEQETQIESMGLPKMDRVTGVFYEAPTERAKSPFPYGRTVFSGRVGSKQLALDFFKSIKDPRFKTLQKITGAYQGRDETTSADKYILNQLRDAFYIWCAEHNNCDYLLTLDFKLVKMVRNCKAHQTSVKVVKPSELLAELGITPKEPDEKKDSFISESLRFLKSMLKRDS